MESMGIGIVAYHSYDKHHSKCIGKYKTTRRWRWYGFCCFFLSSE